MKLIFSSSGKKVAPLPEGKDLYIDCRAVHDPSGTHASGNSIPCQLAIREVTPITAYVDIVANAIKNMGHRRSNNSKKAADDPMTIHCFCAYGVHRSVAMKHILSKDFALMGYDVVVE